MNLLSKKYSQTTALASKKPKANTATLFFLLLCLLGNNGCNEFLDIDLPKAQLVGGSVFEDKLTASSAMAGIYFQLGGNSFAGGSVSSVTYVASLLSDDAEYLGDSPDYVGLNTSAILPTNGQVRNLWVDAYSIIYQANLIIEKLRTSDALDTPLRDRLVGEALFIRGFTYFYLVNLFGAVPYTTTTDYRVNTSLIRTDAEEVLAAIAKDLDQAATLLPDSYVSGERVRPNRWASLALLARIHLYQEDWVGAASYATQLLDNTSLFALESVDSVFLKGSREAIWQLIPSHLVVENFTNEGSLFIINGAPSGLVMREETATGIWEHNDKRRLRWVGVVESDFGQAYYPWKYKESSINATGAEYSMVLRLTEMLLVRAEALARSGDIEAAKADVDRVRMRAGLSGTAATSTTELVEAVLAERRREFFAEWGHRWFDLKRTDAINEVMVRVKPNWQSSDVLLPLPETELLVNPKLAQNPGY